MPTTELIETMIQRIVRGVNPLRVILFGSQARGDAHRHSDIDPWVLLSNVVNKRQTTIVIRRIVTDFPIGKDIIVTTPDEISRRGDLVGTVLRPALREGRVMYERT